MSAASELSNERIALSILTSFDDETEASRLLHSAYSPSQARDTLDTKVYSALTMPSPIAERIDLTAPDEGAARVFGPLSFDVRK